MIDDDFIVTVNDLRSVGVCVKGQRGWFKERGYDFAKVIADGVLASELVATGDGIAIRSVETLKERRRG